jgi:hypothetical protein
MNVPNLTLRLFIATVLLSCFAGTSATADAWNCQFNGHGGIWQVIGNDLVAPATSGSTHFPIAQQSDDAIIALSNEFQGRHFETVALDRRRMAIRIFLFDLDGSPDQQQTGQCTRLDGNAAMSARSVDDNIRSSIRKLVREAQNLANQGFVTAANVKLDEARDSERITPQEAELIGQMKAYVASKLRR